MQEWIEEKIHKKPGKKKKKEVALTQSSNVVDFVALLKKSLAHKKIKKTKHAASQRKTK